ncbi:MAG: 4-alpha-glucanotransferase [Nocardioides sp.]|nr:4-alpha-glucanotransferase [Nocardioides sp.]
MTDEWGVQQDYIGADDLPHRVDDAVVAAVREAIGRPPADLEDTAPVVTRPGRSTGLRGTVACEDGSTRELDDVLDDDFPLGYHDVTPAAGGPARRLIVSPGRCHLPDTQQWGWAVQLYAVWSRRSTGLGDLGDLRTLREWTGQHGGGFVLVNPLHAVAPVEPLEPSPYLPATRRYRNPVYVALDAVPGMVPPEAVTEPEPTPGVLDRDPVWRHKRARLRATYDAGLAPADAERFAAWRADLGTSLEDFATWMVLAADHGADWHDWPADLRDPRGAAVAAVAADRADDVTFEAWQQWLLAEHLEAASGGLTVVQDLPIGVSGGGADSWAWQGIMADGVTVGCPPDAMNARGQDWGSPPLTPWRLRAADYEPFVEAVRATIAGAGGLRIDHVMGLFRLWWIPQGAAPTEGAYVRYPADDLLDIVCLESHRAGAVVVGEDLGTVEDGVREALAERGMLGYRVWWFEADDPADWDRLALGSVTTHDLPTVAGAWTGSDADDQKAVGAMDDADIDAGRAGLLDRLDAAGVAEEATAQDATRAAYASLAEAPSLLLALTLEDAVCHERRPNVPGTVERDNWRVPLPLPLEDLLGDPGPAALVRTVTDDA